MAQNIFMAHSNFVIPLYGLGKEFHRRLDGEAAKFIKSYYCAEKNDIECRYISLEKHDFYFKSFPYGRGAYVFHKVTLEPYLISYRLSPEYKQKRYFLVVSIKTNKCFAETYIDNHGLILQPSCYVCTDRDLIYLQKAFYERPEDYNSRQGLFYPLNDPTENHITWVKNLCSKLEGKKARDVSFEYSAICVISSDIDLTNLPVVNLKETLDKRMAKYYYASQCPDFEHNWKGKDARFAMCLICGNDNINNVSESAIKEFAEHYYSANKHEKTYANKMGIVFLQTHYPFDLSANESERYRKGTLPIYWQGDLEGDHGIPELCTALFFKQKLARISKRLGERRVTSVKDALARLANYLRMEHTHIEDIDKRFMFIFHQMGIVDNFIHLNNEAELLFNSYSLRLSTRFNKLMVLLAAVALFPTVLQIIQSYLYNQKTSFMEHVCCKSAIVVHHSQSCNDGYCCHDPIIFALIVFAFLLVLIGLYHYVFIPYVKKKHKQFHEEMEDEM